MPIAFLKDRSLILHFALFIVGALVLIYQASGISILGDSVNFLCVAYFISGFFSSRLRHIFENAFLVTLGYMTPLVLRNLLKEKGLTFEFIGSALTSLAMTFLFGLLFVSLGYIVSFLLKRLRRSLKGHTSLK